MSATPVYTYYGVADQIDLNPQFYWHQNVYADPYNLLGPQTPWACATPLAYSYGPRRPPQMPPVKG